jgi:RNA polymerase-binding protein DksA
LTADEIEHFKQMLLEKRGELLSNVSEMEDETLNKSRLNAAGDLSSMPIHMADLGTDNYDQEFTLGLMDSERKLLKEIDDALQRIENGVYGLCEGTGGQISKARLEAQPWARYCVEYARKLEESPETEPGQQTPD